MERKLGDRQNQNKRRSTFGMFVKSSIRQKQFKTFRGFRTAIGLILFTIIVIFFMSGAINQKSFFSGIMDNVLKFGQKVGSEMNDTVENKENDVFLIDEGIYLKDFVGENGEKIKEGNYEKSEEPYLPDESQEEKE